MGGKTMGRINKNGQNLIEYTIVVSIVTASVVAMTTYVFRAVQATQQMIYKESSRE